MERPRTRDFKASGDRTRVERPRTQDRTEPARTQDRTDRPERPDRTDRPDRPRTDSSDRPRSSDRPERSDRPRTSDRPDRSSRPSSDRPSSSSSDRRSSGAAESRGNSSSPRPETSTDDRRLTRSPEAARVVAPEIDEDVQFSDLDRAVRARLRTLSKENAEGVGHHLVMAGRLLDTFPELAYDHAQAAVRRAGRVDVVREAAGLAAYRTGRFAEALRELRTVRRLNGSSEHLAIMADCERGLGRPERALALAASEEAATLEGAPAIELAIVASGARLDLGEPEAAFAVLAENALAKLGDVTGVLAVRVAQARAAALEALGRHEDAASSLAGFSAAELSEAAGEEAEGDVVVFDLDEDGAGDGADEHPAAPVVDAKSDQEDRA